MASWKEGDKVKIKHRSVTPEDRKLGRYYEHMSGLSGIVENVYVDGSIAVSIDKDTLSQVSLDVHNTAIRRMREKFLDGLSEEGKKALEPHEINFDAHFMHIVQSIDLEPVS